MPEVKASTLRSRELDPLFDDPAVMRALDMMGLDPYLTQDNILLWADTVKNIESSGGKNTSNKETSAKGNYQFVDDTYRSYLQSYKNALEDVGEELPVWAESELDAEDGDRDPRRLTDLQQKTLLIVGTHARGKDEVIIPAWTGDLEGAGMDLFYNTHYAGDPKLITKYVVNREFDKNADKVVTVIDDEPVEPQGKVPPTMLGDLMIDMPKEKEPVGASDFPFPEGQNDLTEVTPTQRGQVPVLGVGTPRRPKRTGMFSEIEVDAQRVDETPPPLPELQEVTPTQRGQVPIPQAKQADPAPTVQVRPQQSEPTIESQLRAIQDSIINAERVIPDEPFVPGPEAIVEEPPIPEPEKIPESKQGWGGFTGIKAKPEPVEVNAPLNMKAVFEGARIKHDRDQKQRKGITRSIMEGASFNLSDELEAEAQIPSDWHELRSCSH